jgi:hypothetical protein
MYVEDISTLPKSHSESALRQLVDINDGLAHIHSSVTLLELSIVGLTASDPVPFDDVYDVGFYGHGALYNIGYVMAKAIVENVAQAVPLQVHIALYATTQIRDGQGPSQARTEHRERLERVGRWMQVTD